MNIGIVPNPTQQHNWAQIKAFLEPAAKLGGVPVLECHEEVWTIVDDGELLGAATARLTARGGEIVLVGGRDHKRWVNRLSDRLGDWFRMEGKTVMRFAGRKGWRRVLKDWEVIGERDGVTAYEKVLL